jgi:hypothetical protein
MSFQPLLGPPVDITFNAYARPVRSSVNTTLVYSDDPVVRLILSTVTDPNTGAPIKDPNTGAPLRRIVPRQRYSPALANLGAGNFLGTDGNWAFAIYQLHVMGGQGVVPATPQGTAQGFGEKTPRPVEQTERRGQLPDIATVDANAVVQAGSVPQICLFNLVVALEWEADKDYLLQLEWAFRRASDFLLDVTDGLMAIGQVIIGGPSLMDVADIQIMASNRLLPRAWVDGMHDSNKYQPIRVGRGLWSKNRRTTIAWDEPEAYRTLIHEFAHYALALKDQYVDRTNMQAVPAAQLDVELRKDAGNLSTTNATRIIVASTILFQLATPSIALAIESIMNNLEGTSELVHHQVPRVQSQRVSEWTSITQKQEFAGLVPPNFLGSARQSGPGLLPLPFPSCVSLLTVAQPLSPIKLQLDPKPPIDSKYCWVFVLRNLPPDPANWGNALNARTVELVAQGSLEATSAADGFPLMGAAVGDTVVLVSYTNGTAPIPQIMWRRLDGSAGDTVSSSSWNTAMSSAQPLVVVEPLTPPAGSPSSARSIALQVNVVNSTAWQSWVFPQGALPGSPTTVISATPGQPIHGLPSLDGHVLLLGTENDQSGQPKPVLSIAAYSIGGNPASAYPGHPNPIAAGSSEGNAMLFFADSAIQGVSNDPADNAYDTYRVITTLNYAIAPTKGPIPRSYAFAVASNKPLPDNRRTLILYYDKNTNLGQQALRICRYDQNLAARICTPIPTYLPREYSYAAAPLAEGTADRLIAGNDLVEVYQLCLV